MPADQCDSNCSVVARPLIVPGRATQVGRPGEPHHVRAIAEDWVQAGKTVEVLCASKHPGPARSQGFRKLRRRKQKVVRALYIEFAGIV
jgi:hypothetical protein